MQKITIGRIAFLVVAVLVYLGALVAAFDPATNRDEFYTSFILGLFVKFASLILTAVLLPYVVWRFIKRDLPIFWLMVLVISAFPLLLFFVLSLIG